MKKFSLLLLANIASVLFITNSTNAQNAVADSLFATKSKLTIPLSGAVSGNFILQPDGKIFYGGTATSNGGDFSIAMMRYDECGILDSSFGVIGNLRHNFNTRNVGNAYTLQSDGKIVCVGRQAPSNAGSQQRACVSRFNSDGSPDLTFNLTGTHPLLIASGRFYSVQVMADGKIVCFGDFGSGLGAGVARFMPDGSLDTTFNTDGVALFNSPGFGFFDNTRGFVLPDGKFLLSSYVSDITGTRHFMAFRLDTSGLLDSTYGVNGIYYDSLIPVDGFNFPLTSAMDTNGNLLLTRSSNNTVFDILRLTPSGTLDPTFGTDGRVTYDSGATITGIQILTNGKILIRGRSNILFLPNGTPDEAFGIKGLRQFNFDNNTDIRPLDGLLELPNGQWITAFAANSFLFKKYGNVSNFPHISQTGIELSTVGIGSYKWFLEGLAISDAMNQTFTPVQNGNYSVMITDINGCKGTSPVFSVTNLGINDNSINKKINIYPNPTTGMVTITNQDNLAIDKIEIVDVLGKIVSVKTENTSQIGISEMTNGLYFLKMYSGENVFVKKIIKN